MLFRIGLFLRNAGVAAGDQMCGTAHKGGSYGSKEILNGPERYIHALAPDSAELRRPDRARAVTDKASGARREIA